MEKLWSTFPAMEKLWSTVVPPPPKKVLVPPMFDYPRLACRTRMMESMYNLMFAKMALRHLFDSYLEGTNRISTRMLQLSLDSSSSSFICNVTAPLNQNSEEGVVGDAEFRLERDGAYCEAVFDICVSNTGPPLLLRSSMFFPKMGIAAYWRSGPFFKNEISSSGDDGTIGIQCGNGNFFFGYAFTHNMERLFLQNAWFVSKIGALTAGAQFESKFGSKDKALLLENWSFAIGYGKDLENPYTPSFNCGLQFANNSQFIASFYQHMVVQRLAMYPFEEKVVRITNYLDFGVELQTRIDNYKNKIRDSTFQFVASWQANKNFLVKGKVGPLSSSIALVFKSWWNPAFTFNILAARDPTKGETSFGFGFQVEINPYPRYGMAHPEYLRCTPNQEHLLGSTNWNAFNNNGAFGIWSNPES